MSWLKFWSSKKSKSKDDKKSRADLMRSGSFHDDSQWQAETEKDKNSRLKHTMSISRSGRFKQKKKERSGFLDKPELYDGQNEASANEVQKENISRPNGQGKNYNNNSPHGTCRDVSHRFDTTQSGHQHTVL